MLEVVCPEIDPKSLKQRTASYPLQFKTLMWRNIKLMKREPRVSVAKIGQNIFMSLLIIPLWWDISYLTTVNVTNMVGVMFFTLTSQVMSSYIPSLLVF